MLSYGKKVVVGIFRQHYAIPVLSLGLGLAGCWWLATRRKVVEVRRRKAAAQKVVADKEAAAVLMADAAAAYKLAKNAGRSTKKQCRGQLKP